MELIYKKNLIKEKIIELIKHEDTHEIYISVAWATMNEVTKELKKYEKKIHTFIVGISSEITHPSFLKAFKNKVQVVEDNKILNGIFHSKIYLFTNKDKSAWQLLIGSANLTGRAINNNEETMILIDNISNNSFNIDQIYELLKYHFSLSIKIDTSFINKYKKIYEKSRQIEENFSYEGKLNELSWEDYEYYIKKRVIDGNYAYVERLQLLELAKDFFRNISDINPKELSCLLGISKTLNNLDKNINWHNFGHMRASNKKMISEIRKKLNCINYIPFYGEIYETTYRQYMNEILNIKGVSISIASRLLALKRPDFFFCVTGGNESKLEQEFEVSKPSSSDINKIADSYWGLIKVIHQAKWNEDKEGKDSILWNSRIAMLDTILFRV